MSIIFKLQKNNSFNIYKWSILILMLASTYSIPAQSLSTGPYINIIYGPNGLSSNKEHKISISTRPDSNAVPWVESELDLIGLKSQGSIKNKHAYISLGYIARGILAFEFEIGPHETRYHEEKLTVINEEESPNLVEQKYRSIKTNFETLIFNFSMLLVNNDLVNIYGGLGAGMITADTELYTYGIAILDTLPLVPIRIFHKRTINEGRIRTPMFGYQFLIGMDIKINNYFSISINYKNQSAKIKKDGEIHRMLSTSEENNGDIYKQLKIRGIDYQNHSIGFGIKIMLGETQSNS